MGGRGQLSMLYFGCVGHQQGKMLLVEGDSEKGQQQSVLQVRAVSVQMRVWDQSKGNHSAGVQIRIFPNTVKTPQVGIQKMSGTALQSRWQHPAPGEGSGVDGADSEFSSEVRFGHPRVPSPRYSLCSRVRSAHSVYSVGNERRWSGRNKAFLKASRKE